MSEPVEGVAGEDIKAGEKILLCSDGYWRRKVSTEPREQVAQPKPKARKVQKPRSTRRR